MSGAKTVHAVSVQSVGYRGDIRCLRLTPTTLQTGCQQRRGQGCSERGAALCAPDPDIVPYDGKWGARAFFHPGLLQQAHGRLQRASALGDVTVTDSRSGGNGRRGP